MKSPNLRFLAGVLLGTTLGVAPAAAAPTAATDDIFALDPFMVRPESDPQRAANTSAGTAFNTEIKQLPVQVQVFTPEYMESVGATDIYGALTYAGSVNLIPNPESAQTNPFGQTSVATPNISVRGQAATGATNIIKDGFKRLLITDTAFISRIDLLSGPAGALYGEGNLGGAVAYTGVVPPRRTTVKVSEMIGNFNYARSVLSVGGPITSDGRLRFVFPVTYQRGGIYSARSHDNRIAANPTIVYKPVDKTTLRVSYEYGEIDRSATDSGINMNNDSAAFGVNPPNRVLTSAANYILSSPDLKTFRWAGPDTFARQRGYSVEFILTQQITPDLYLYGGYNSEAYHRSTKSYAITLQTGSNGTGANGMAALAADPAYKALLRSDGAVVRYFPNEYYGDGYEVQPAYLLNLYYHKALSFVDLKFVAGGYYSSYAQSQDKGRIRYLTSDSSSLSQNLTGLTNQTDINGNTVNVAPRITEPQALLWYRSPTDYSSVYRWSNFAGMPQTPYPTYVVSNFFDKNLYLNSISRWWHDRFIANIGILYLRADRNGKVYRSAGNPYGPKGSQVLASDPDLYGFNTNPYAVFPSNAHLVDGTLVAGRLVPLGAATPYYTTNPASISYAGNNQFNNSSQLGTFRPKPIKSATPSVSLSWMVTPDLNVYGNGSTALDPGPTYSGRDGNNVPVDAPIYQNREVGLKWEAWHERVWLTADYFTTTSDNFLSNIAWAFNNYNTTGFGAYVKETMKVKGADFGLDFKVTDNLRIFPNYSYNQGEITSVAPFVTPNNQTPGILAVQQGTANTDGSIYIGTNPFNQPQKQARLRIRYDFTTGLLKGLWIQPGYSYSGSAKVVVVTNGTTTTNAQGVIVTTPPSFTTGILYSRRLYNLDVGYNFRIRRQLFRAVLNLTNLDDNRQWYQAGANGYFNPPLTERLSLSADF